MNYLILNGMNAEDTFIAKINEFLKKKFTDKDIEGEILNLYEFDIKPCLGCFKCWIETPGKCVIDDYGRTVAKKMIQSDYLLYVTPITYGGYSAELKKAIDRSISLLSPFFRIYHNEIHHEKRYDKYPDFIVIGTLSEQDENQEEIFAELVHRNSLNNFAEQVSSQIIYESDDDRIVQNKLEECLNIVGEKNE